MLSAQEHTPHDVMSAIYPKPIRTLPRMLQEGGLVMSSGSSWFLWVNRLAPEQFSHLRECYGLVNARREALGRTHSLNPVAVLLSETSWEHGLISPESGYFDSGTPRNLSFALQDAHFGVDVVNERTLREQIGHWRIVVLANQRQASSETLGGARVRVHRQGRHAQAAGLPIGIAASRWLLGCGSSPQELVFRSFRSSEEGGVNLA
jgi:hypothetical protein